MLCSHVGYYVTCVGPVFNTGFLSSLRHHAFHSESLLGVVEAEERGLAETQHTACAQSKTTINKVENKSASHFTLSIQYVQKEHFKLSFP